MKYVFKMMVVVLALGMLLPTKPTHASKSLSISSPIQSKYITLNKNKSDFYNWGIILSYLDECTNGKFGWHDKIWKIEMFLKHEKENSYVKEIKLGRKIVFWEKGTQWYERINRHSKHVWIDCNSSQTKTYYLGLMTLIDNIKNNNVNAISIIASKKKAEELEKEKQKRLALQRKAEEARRIAEAKRKIEEEKQKRLALQRKAEEARRIAEAKRKIVEEKRVEGANRKIEEAKLANHNSTLNCKMNKYDFSHIGTVKTYHLTTVQSIIPSNYILHLTSKIANITTASGGHFKNYKIEVTRITQDKIYFQYMTKDRLDFSSTTAFRPWKHIYFKKSKKLNVSFAIGKEKIEIWGDCSFENTKKDTLIASQNLKTEDTKRNAEVKSQEVIKLMKKLAALEKKQKEQQQLKPKIVVAKKPKSEFPLKPIPINFPSVSIKRDDIAVIIGNANYKKQGKDIPNVNPAYADAEGIKQYFMKAKGIKEGNIIYLKDATGAQLLGVFGNEKSHKGKLFNYIKPNKSNVYIYYAGHGAPGEEGDAYLVPTDTDSQTIEFTGYPLSTLFSNLGKLPAKSMTVILEACFSGGSQSGSLISKASPIIIQPKKTMIPNNIKVIAAGSERQMASWEEDSSHSLFTKYFLKAMSGEGDTNKDGKVSDTELKEYLSDTMTYYARRYYGRDQKVQIHNGG